MKHYPLFCCIVCCLVIAFVPFVCLYLVHAAEKQPSSDSVACYNYCLPYAVVSCKNGLDESYIIVVCANNAVSIMR